MDEEQSELDRLVDRRPPQADEREAETVTRREARGARRHRGHLTSRGPDDLSRSASLSEAHRKMSLPDRPRTHPHGGSSSGGPSVTHQYETFRLE